MTVYVEYVIIDNFIFDYFLLSLALKNSNERQNKKRILLGAGFGTVMAIVFPMLKLHELLLLGLKVILACLMVAISGKFMSFKEFFKKVNKLVFLTFFFGGAIYGALSLLELEYSFLYTTSNSLIPLGVLIGAGYLLYVGCNRLFNKLFERKMIYPFVCECVLYGKGQILKTRGFLDTGNHLLYHKTFPVCFASTELAKKLIISGIVEGSAVERMLIKTVSGEAYVKIYEIERMQIYFGDKANIYYNVKIAVSEKGLRLSDDFHLILSANYAVAR